MSTVVTKKCADFLRDDAGFEGKLKATHAHEIVAAFFGYRTRAALLADQDQPLSRLSEAAVLVPNSRLIGQRLKDLAGLPALPTASGITKLIGRFLRDEGFTRVDVSDSIEERVVELLPDYIVDILDDLAGIMAETNAYFEDADFEEAQVVSDGDTIELLVTGQLNGSNDEDRCFCGDTIDMSIEVSLPRIGKVAFGAPEIVARGEVNHDWVDPDL